MQVAETFFAVSLGVALILLLFVDWTRVLSNSMERWHPYWNRPMSPSFYEQEPRIADLSTTLPNVGARRLDPASLVGGADGVRQQNHTTEEKSEHSAVCVPRTNFVFMKVHKAGSSTTTPIVARYALRNNLAVMFPLGRGTLSWPNIPQIDDYIHTPDEVYNVLFHHTVYNKQWMESTFPANTAYLSILREPFSHLKSSFHFYKLDYLLRFKNKENPVKEFLEDPGKYHTSGVLNGVLVDKTRNAQAFDMGYSVEKAGDMKSSGEYIKQLDRDFTLFLILEYLDHSLVLLRRLMCWELRDMLYDTTPKNDKTYPYKFYQPTRAEREAHRHLSPVEYAMYEHFNQTLWRKIEEEGPDFFKELEYFRQVNQEVNDFCRQNHPKTAANRPRKHIPKSPWGNAFDVTLHLCTLLRIDYSTIDSLIRRRQGRPVLQKACEKRRVQLKANLYFILDGRPSFDTLGDVMKYDPKKDSKPLVRQQLVVLEKMRKYFQKCKKKQKRMKDHFHEKAGKFKVKYDKMSTIPKELLDLSNEVR